MNYTKLIFAHFILLGSFLVNFFVGTSAYGQGPSQPIDATVKISICGNGIIEGGEDCEGNDLNDMRCRDLGFAGGNLTCDVACQFDTAGCHGTAPTPTPQSSPGGSEKVESGVQRGQSEGGSVEERRFIEEIIELFQPLVIIVFPETIAQIGLNNEGFFPPNRIIDVLSYWVGEVRTKSLNNENCDLNGDGVCDLVDFSILMYYVR
jgi:hypothetical protein